jgi:uncharacterized protein
MFEKPELSILKNRIAEPRRFINVIVGPRQIGKTTLAKQLLDSLQIPSLFLSADAVPSANQVWISQQWESVRVRMKLSEMTEFVLVIDEI